MTGLTRLDVYEIELRKDILIGIDREVPVLIVRDLLTAYGLDGFARLMMEASQQTAESTEHQDVAKLQSYYQAIIHDMLVKADNLVGRRS